MQESAKIITGYNPQGFWILELATQNIKHIKLNMFRK